LSTSLSIERGMSWVNEIWAFGTDEDLTTPPERCQADLS